MKRYRVLSFDIDSGAAILSTEIRDSWEPEVREAWQRNKEEIRQELIEQFGTSNSEIKIRNYIDLGSAPFSIVAFHNAFFRQARFAFIIGSYYPALTSVCALGERVLNHLMIGLRGAYSATPEYKRVYNKNSFDDWNLAITVLSTWGVLLPDTVAHYTKLAEIRNQAIHYTPDIDTNTRFLALRAIKTFADIISSQFAAIGGQPWFIPDTPGASFIKKGAELIPFIRLVYLPKCALVGPKHRLEFEDFKIKVIDSSSYEEKEISDAEFANLFRGNSN